MCYSWVQATFLNSAPPKCNSHATRWWSFVTPLAVKYDLKHRFHCTAKFERSSLRLKQGSSLASVLNKLAELGAYSPLDALSLFYDMSIFKRTLCIYKTVEITFLNGDKDLFPRRQCNIPVWFSKHDLFYISFTNRLNQSHLKRQRSFTGYVYPGLRELSNYIISCHVLGPFFESPETFRVTKISLYLQ